MLTEWKSPLESKYRSKTYPEEIILQMKHPQFLKIIQNSCFNLLSLQGLSSSTPILLIYSLILEHTFRVLYSKRYEFIQAHSKVIQRPIVPSKVDLAGRDGSMMGSKNASVIFLLFYSFMARNYILCGNHDGERLVDF